MKINTNSSNTRMKSVLEKTCGTHNPQDENVELKKGEWLMVSDGIHDNPSRWKLREFVCIRQNVFMMKNSDPIYSNTPHRYAIQFKHFNPSNMEETKKHIISVSYGSVINLKNNK